MVNKMKIEKFDRKTTQRFVGEMKSALKPFMDECDVRIEKSNATYDNADTMSVKITFNRKSGKSTMQRDFEINCDLFGLKSTDFGREFFTFHPLMGHTKIRANKKYRIVGLKPRSRKYPIVVELVASVNPNGDLVAMSDVGKQFKFGDETVVRLLKRTDEYLNQ